MIDVDVEGRIDDEKDLLRGGERREWRRVWGWDEDGLWIDSLTGLVDELWMVIVCGLWKE